MHETLLSSDDRVLMMNMNQWPYARGAPLTYTLPNYPGNKNSPGMAAATGLDCNSRRRDIPIHWRVSLVYAVREIGDSFVGMRKPRRTDMQVSFNAWANGWGWREFHETDGMLAIWRSIFAPGWNLWCLRSAAPA